MDTFGSVLICYIDLMIMVGPARVCMCVLYPTKNSLPYCVQKLINTFIPVHLRTTCQLIHTSFTPSGRQHVNPLTPLFMPIWACSIYLFLFYNYLLSYLFTQSVSHLNCCKLLLLISKTLITIIFLSLGIPICVVTWDWG